MRHRLPFIAAVAVVLVCAMAVAQTAPPAPSPAPVPAPVEVRGVVKSGSSPLPGVAITAVTPSGPAVATSTDVDGSFMLTLKPGRYRIRAELSAFSPMTKEILLGPAAPAPLAFELVLLSRAQQQISPGTVAAAAQMAGNVVGRGMQRLDVNADENGASSMQTGMQSAELPGMPAMASSPDAGNESMSISAGRGAVEDFSTRMADWQERAEEMRQRGEGGPGGPGGPGGGGPGVFGGGQGGFGIDRRQAIRVLRSGNFNINRPHGMVMWTTDNSVLDAAPYQLSTTSPGKQDYSSNRISAAVGGPTRIPLLTKKGNNDFFFVNVAIVRNQNPFQSFSHVPTELEREGNFSQSFITTNGVQTPVQLFNPATGLPFVNQNGVLNAIPTAQLNSAALGLLNYIPLPNASGARNFVYAGVAPSNSENINLRLMHPIGAGSSTRRRGGRGGGPMAMLGGRNSISLGFNYSRNDTDLSYRNPFPTITGDAKTRSYNANVGYTTSWKRLTNVLRTSFNSNHTETTNQFAGVTNIAKQLSIGGVSQNPSDWGLPTISMSQYTGLSDFAPVDRRNDVFSVNDTLSWVRGKHTVRFGGDYRRLANTVRSNTNPNGNFVFTGFATGYALADFLVGTAQQTSIQYSANAFAFRANSYSAFINEDWRMRGNLTLTLGLRYEYIGPYTEVNNQLVNLDVAPNFTAAAAVQPGQQGLVTGVVYPLSLVKPDHNNFAPRLGFAWKAFKKTVVRGGYSIQYNLGQYSSMVQNLAYQPPFSFTQTNTYSDPQAQTLQNGFPATTTALTNNYGVDPNYRLGYVQLWNLNIQRELPAQMVLNIGYQGSKGTGLDMVRAPNRDAEGGLRIDGVQPFLWETSQGSSIMHGATVRLRKRMKNGVALGASYTFSKSIDNASSIGGGTVVVAQNDLDLAAERGLSSFDQRHRFTGDWMFELPFGEGRHWMTSHSPLERVVGDWQMSGSFTIASGLPFTARVLNDIGDVSRGTNGTLRADYTGAPIALSNPSVSEWFNTGAFIAPPTGQYGNAGRNTITGPGSVVVSMAMTKVVPLRDIMGLEFRMEAANVFNTPQFTTIDTVVNSPTFGQVIGVGSTRRVSFTTRFRF